MESVASVGGEGGAGAVSGGGWVPGGAVFIVEVEFFKFGVLVVFYTHVTDLRFGFGEVLTGLGRDKSFALLSLLAFNCIQYYFRCHVNHRFNRTLVLLRFLSLRILGLLQLFDCTGQPFFSTVSKSALLHLLFDFHVQRVFQ